MKFKQAIIIRTDIGMGKGKIAGQVAHAAVSSAESIRKYCPEWYYSWLEEDNIQDKIILKLDSESKLQDLARDAFDSGINPAKIYDAGRTQLEPNTFTSLGIGPAPEEMIDPLIKDLKLHFEPHPHLLERTFTFQFLVLSPFTQCYVYGLTAC